MGDPAIDKANASLKASGVAVSIEQRRQSLYLRGRLPDKSDPSVSKHQRLPLGLLATRDGIKEAIAMALQINNELEAGTFEWSAYSSERGVRQSSANALQEYKDYYFSTRPDNPQTQTTWKDSHENILKKLPAGRPTEKAALDLLRSYEPERRIRQLAHSVLSAYMRFHRIPYDKDYWANLRGTYSSKGPKEREIPSDEEIGAIWEATDDPLAKLCVGMLATFGLRTSELFHLDTTLLQQGGNTVTVDTKAKSKKKRVVYAFPKDWIDRFELRQPWPLMALEGETNKKLGGKITKLFNRLDLPHSYVYRHAYRLRCLKAGIDPVIASRSLGHSVAIGMEHYTRWMNEKDVSDAFDKDV